MIGNTVAARFSDFVSNLPTIFVDPVSGLTKADGLAIAEFLNAARHLVLSPPLSAGAWNGGH